MSITEQSQPVKEGAEQTSRNLQVDKSKESEPINDFQTTNRTLKMAQMAKFIGEEHVGQFIKKVLKIYKGLRVLERNKQPDTPFFSRSIEKLIRFFSKKFPENCGLDGSLSELAYALRHQQKSEGSSLSRERRDSINSGLSDLGVDLSSISGDLQVR